MTTIKDAKLNQWFSQVVREKASNPGRKVDEKDLDTILAAVADRRGLTFSRAQKELTGAARIEDKIELAKPGMSAAEKQDLEAIRNNGQVPLSDGAVKAFDLLVGRMTGPVAPSVNGVFDLKKGRLGFTLDDDRVVLGSDGEVRGQAGPVGMSRNYLALREGVLRFRHGSEAPRTMVLSEPDRKRLNESSPGESLDQVVKIFGSTVDGFGAMATSEDFYDPNAQSWEGVCDGFSWLSLSKLVPLLDVDGPDGMKGVWIVSQWLSRADLGNWAMAVSKVVNQADSDSYYFEPITTDDLVKVVALRLQNNGGGFVADIYNDSREGDQQTWNQPFVGSAITTTAVTGAPLRGLLDKARDVDGAVAAKLMNIRATYITEVSDDHEGPPETGVANWNVYAILNSEGEVLKTYLADDRALNGVAGLPTRDTDALPDMVRVPKLQPVNDVLAGKDSWILRENKYGAEFRFFVEKVLLKGVPGVVRRAFEDEVQALGSTPVTSAQLEALAKKYPGVANGYSPEDWRKHFAPLGLDSKAFGASWKE